MKKVIECSMAIAEAVKLCKPLVIPMYPITPQTHIVERLADLISDGKLDAEMIHVESEHSAISAAIGSVASGVRTFTATASQGLALMHEVLFIASGMRLPIVMAVANRALSAPINIWNDHQDSISERDCGWIQLYVESSQEAVDTIIQAFKIAEDGKVLLPIMVCLDGFTLSHVFEQVDIPEQKKVDKFLPKYKPLFTLDPKKPVTMGPIGYPNVYMQFRKDLQDAIINSKSIIKKTNNDFRNIFGRSYGDGLIETYKITDAEYAIIGMGTLCGTTKVVVDELRSKGEKVGLIKLKCFRPFPKDELVKVTNNLKRIAVLDRNISLGNDGALFTEVKAILSNKNIKGYIIGLGGKDITKDHIKEALKMGKKKWLQ